MRVAGVVILYHPDDTVVQNIQSYLPHVEKLYVADNTEGKMSDIALQLSAQNKVQLLYDGSNEGIAKRLNEAASIAIKEGFQWLLTMDQDSRFEEGSLQNYFSCADNYLHKNKTAMFGVEHEKEKEISQSCEPVEKNRLITSGSLLNITLFQTVGKFNEQLFIDEVDFEYCYRARLKNHLIVQFQNIFLTHAIGVSSQHHSLKNLRVTKRALHSPKRMYFMVRNFLYVNRIYKKQFPNEIRASKKGLLNRIKNNLLYNKKRSSIFLNIQKGFIHYLLNKF